jgi:hypothetical protein
MRTEVEENDDKIISPSYAVQGLDDYMPPWEAALHKRCGLYQDYYLVHWAAPHDADDLDEVEAGSNVAGCSWEPDECLPDEMDIYRVAAKKRWVTQSPKLADPAAAPKKSAKRLQNSASAEEAARRAKIAKTTENKFGNILWLDMHFPSVKHGWDDKKAKLNKELEEGASEGKTKKKLKADWPKQASDYPKGHPPPNPPGPCLSTCDCMEDWHLGDIDMSAKGQNKPEQAARRSKCAEAFERFADSSLVNRRGQVSKQHYLEPRNPGTHQHSADRAQAWEIRGYVLGQMRELALHLPFESFLGEEEQACKTRESLIPALAQAFNTNSLLPSRYKLETSIPWLQIESSTGMLSASCDEPPTLQDDRQDLVVVLVFDNIIGYEEVPMKCALNNSWKANCTRFLTKLTMAVKKFVEKHPSSKYRQAIEPCLGEIFDSYRGTARDVSLGVFAQTFSVISNYSALYANSIF